MGDDAGRPDERPRHAVELDAFAVARRPVSNAEYARFLAATGRESPRFWGDPAFNAPEQPVVAVTWAEANAYCAWLSAATGRIYRLPAEAEWEYAARGGREGLAYPWGTEPPRVDGVSLARVQQSAPATIGMAPANGYGLIDIGFNVHEWCQDWYDAGYYARSPRRNPRGPEQGQRRASRGGAWRHQIKVCRCAARSSLVPDFRYNDYGFRVFADV
jgi:sulfatase modifying factor 1